MRNFTSLQWHRPAHLGEADSAALGSEPRPGDDAAPISWRLKFARTAVIPLAVCIVAGVFVWSFGQAEEAEGGQAITLSATPKGPAPRLGSPAPEFRLSSLDGGVLDLQSFGGRPVWITFWASWCPPCRAESPELVAAYERHAADGLVILAIDVGENPEAVADYVEKAGLPFLVGLDRSTEVAARYRVRGLPTHYFVDANGIIRDMKLGPMGSKEIERRLASVIGEPRQ